MLQLNAMRFLASLKESCLLSGVFRTAMCGFSPWVNCICEFVAVEHVADDVHIAECRVCGMCSTTLHQGSVAAG